MRKQLIFMQQLLAIASETLLNLCGWMPLGLFFAACPVGIQY